jgi:hypothetical protein
LITDSHVLTIGLPKTRVADFTEDTGARVEIRHDAREVRSDARYLEAGLYLDAIDGFRYSQS